MEREESVRKFVMILIDRWK